MPTLWIIHRDAGGRAALARLAGAGDDTVLGAPTDDLFESAGAPDLVVLGLAGDFEAELEFVHRVGSALRGCEWVLVPEASAVAEAGRLFDTLTARILPFPPAPLELRRAIRAGLERRRVDSLSQRITRDRLAEQFSHWFADLELPDLLRALDPHLRGVPLLVRGEPGTGRALVARYVHAFAGASPALGRAQLVAVACDSDTGAAGVLAQLSEGLDPAAPSSVWLEDVDLLAPADQRRLQSFIEFGLPSGLAGARIDRWMASAGDADSLDRDLDPRLAQALAGIAVRIPPLRHRPDAIEPLVVDIAARWCRAHEKAVRRFSADALEHLARHPWPGNLHELDAVVQRTLAATAGDPINAVHLRFDDLQPLSTSPSASSGPIAEPHPGAQSAPIAEPHPAAQSARPTPTQPERPVADDVQGEEADAALEPFIEVTDDVRAEAPEALALTTLEPDQMDGESLTRLVGAVAHEVRNPLTSIRTFAELLPQQFDDPEFRERFASVVSQDVRRIEQVVDQLQELSASSPGELKRVDVASLLEDLLDERREQIRSRNLLVLRELDRNQPFAIGDPQQIDSAFRALIEKAIELVPERGDVYVASRHHPANEHEEASLRILVRYHGGGRGPGASIEGVTSAEAALQFAVAEALIRAQGGVLTLDTTDASETVLVVDLPAPAQPLE